VTSWGFDDTPAATRLLAAIRQQAGSEPFDLAVILGSGWGAATDGLCCLGEFPYREWPCFPAGQVAGHAGRLRVVSWQGWRVLVFLGRWHCYQGFSAHAVTAPVRLAASLGAPRVALTCAAGGINRTFAPGDFMLVSDHLNLLGDNPLKGDAAPFVDLTTLYRTEDFTSLAAVARQHHAGLHSGILAAMPGPSYETPAEIVMLERLGADAVAMSTIPEAIMARCLGQEVVAMALIANLAAGRSGGAIEHADVLACGARATGAAGALLAELINCWQKSPVECRI
jgi:purine-nucleoside phosphorylase